MDNVLKFPGVETDNTDDIFETDNLVIDLSDIDPEAIDKVFEVMTFFSDNSEEIINKNTGNVLEFLSNKADFDGTSFKSSYNVAFREFVMSFLRDEVVEHFNYTPEEIAIIMDEDFIDIITEGKFFDMDNYTTEGVNG